MKFLLLPLKLLAKLSLYIIYSIVALVGIVSLLISTIAGAIFRVISVILFLLLTIALIATHNMENVQQLGTPEIIISYGFIVFVFLLPIFAEAFSEKVIYLSNIIKDFAGFPLLGQKNEQYNFEEFAEDDTYEEENNFQSEQSESTETTSNPASSGFNPFNGVTTMEELEKRYKSLAKCYHPDVAVGSSDEATKAMQFINTEYDLVKSRLS